MRNLKLFGAGLVLTFCILLTTATAEAKTHFSFGLFGFAPTVVEHRVTPVYVEEHYTYAAPVVRRRPPCCDRHVQVASRPAYREVYVYPSYREHVVVRPSPVFSFGIFN
jgi:hypothetical protein